MTSVPRNFNTERDDAAHQEWTMVANQWYFFHTESKLMEEFEHWMKLEGHLVECIPLPRNAWSMRTYRAQHIFEESWYTLLYRFGPISQWWRITLKIIISGSGFGSSPKLNKFFPVTHSTCPPSFVRIIRQLLWDIILYTVFGPITQWWRIT